MSKIRTLWHPVGPRTTHAGRGRCQACRTRTGAPRMHPRSIQDREHRNGAPVSFEVKDVSSWAMLEVEPAGEDGKSWLSDPHRDSSWLFKPRVERHGRVQGEDWAEKVAAELALVLEIPAAVVELAVRGGQRGLISRDVRPDHAWELQPGAVLLSAELGFRGQEPNANRSPARHHSSCAPAGTDPAALVSGWTSQLVRRV